MDKPRVMAIDWSGPAAQPPTPQRNLSMERVRIGTLSSREREILGLLASGWSTQRIARERHLAQATVRSDVQSILVKLGIHSKLEAVAYAYQHDLVTTASPGRLNRHSA